MISTIFANVKTLLTDVINNIMKQFSLFLVVLLLALVTTTANAQEYPRGDVDRDGSVNISDVTSLIGYLLKGSWPDEPEPQQYDYVDLGLPSGTLWATMNVGANSPEEYGDYFAWGEVAPKEVYDWSTYKWCNGSEYTLTKYCADSEYGTVDNKTDLDLEDDAVYVNWGPSWRMPTSDQLEELKNNCTWQWTEMNGVKGSVVTGPNGNTMFLLAAGAINGSAFERVGQYGYLWSCALNSDGATAASYLYFNASGGHPWSRLRYFGFTVRGVYVSQD